MNYYRKNLGRSHHCIKSFSEIVPPTYYFSDHLVTGPKITTKLTLFNENKINKEIVPVNQNDKRSCVCAYCIFWYENI